MKDISDKLLELSPQLLMDIEASYYSIYKINQKSHEFQTLKKDFQELQNAIYILNPNFNNANGNIFLNATGETIFQADFFSNLITHEALDFEYEVKEYWRSNPLEKLLIGTSAAELMY